MSLPARRMNEKKLLQQVAPESRVRALRRSSRSLMASFESSDGGGASPLTWARKGAKSSLPPPPPEEVEYDELDLGYLAEEALLEYADEVELGRGERELRSRLVSSTRLSSSLSASDVESSSWPNSFSYIGG
jgi:hypothetical protein